MTYKFKSEAEKKQFIDLLRRSGDTNRDIAFPAQYQMAKALELPLRQGVLGGDVVRFIYEAVTVEMGGSLEWPLDLLAPGEEDEFVAFTNPGNGRIPERSVEGDYVMIPTYSIANSIDWLLKFAREGRYDVAARALQVMEAGVVKKINDDGWHTLITAAADRNILVYDADASAGQFTKRLISLMKVTMRRSGGGNTASVKRGRLTDMFVSPEAIEDIRNWNIDQVDDQTRREIFLSEDGGITRIYSVNLHDMDEFGVGQEYQNYYTSALGASMQASDTEMVVGLDLVNKDSFVMPIKQEFEMYPDPALHRQQREGYYGWGDYGFGVLDNRRLILGSF